VGFQLALSEFNGVIHETVNVNESFDEKVHTEGRPNERIAVLSSEATIEDAPENILGAESDYQPLQASIERAAADSTVEQVGLRDNSPVGGVLESADIHRQLVELKEEYDKPLYVSMGNTAASGGYYVSALADKIYADAATITGSIGVIMQ